MTTAKVCLFLITLALFSYGCSSGNTGKSLMFGKGKYKFVMYDSTGSKKVIEGRMTVSTYSLGNISGTLEYTKVYDTNFSGYSSMSNEFQGTYDPVSRKLWINTNPKLADSNVFWNAGTGKSSLSGEWNHSVFRGSGTKGKLKITPAN